MQRHSRIRRRVGHEARLCVRSVLCRLVSPRPGAFPPSPPLPVARPCSGTSLGLRTCPTSRDRASSATAPCLPDADQTALACGRARDLPVPAHGASAHARVSDRAGSSSGSRSRRPPCCLPLSRRRRHPEQTFAAQWLAYAFPCQRFAARLAGRRRMPRAQCGSLLLHCSDFHHLLLAALPAHRDGSRDDFFASVVNRSDAWSGNPPWLAVRLSQVPQVRCLTPPWAPVQRCSASAFGSL
jgi:hypothetical protein